jgi:hypothetical protein
VEANRQNSLHSTGPTTPQGKKNSSCNSRKHCLLAKDIVITSGPGKENESEFASSHGDLWDYYQPVGSEEERLVGELAACHWVTRRAYRGEKGAITLGSEISHTNPELSEAEQAMLGFKPPGEARYDLLQSSRALTTFFERLNTFREEVLSGGDAGLAPKWLLPDGVWKATFGLEARVAILEKETASLKALKVHVELEEADKRAAERDLAAIPKTDAPDRIQRYQTGNRRHIYKLEARLDQLQARRKERAANARGDAEAKAKR